MPGNRHVPFLGEGAAATLLPLPDFLAAYLDPAEYLPSCAQYVVPWEGAEARLRAAHERVKERATAGQTLPQSFGVPRVGARLPESLREPKQEPVLLLSRRRLEAWLERSEPPVH